MGNYVYLGKRRQYAIIRNKVSDTEFLVKVKKGLGGSPSLAAT